MAATSLDRKYRLHSVIVPVFNEYETLTRIVEQISDQYMASRGMGVEIILVDDGFTGRCMGNGDHVPHRSTSACSAFVRPPHFFGGCHGV